ncbi:MULTISPECIES: acetyl-CoA carboxylase biotin carboxyl carrier protein subunit [Pandoraea]|uniref:Acetyl-CoA carboxylase biotin carboxyl carrier protein subunit n=2 Tax=Pandoraea TaxID=93217 RepID=A0A5E4RR11_9BURK|nr:MULTISPECIES: acetyl-CoA carboxylase biotin carboxyl carrier protein subunit [Pandoraea]UVA77208.1 acetyl-CoA carboxylase biotin carboxyl carrier protein subunit [Pandoraea commovens]VVD63969.1 biotinylated protein [Pandoraea aquatica]VVD64308.1 biotinylated protein [Pandoraea commovens]
MSHQAIRSEITGTVCQVLVAEGDTVSEDQALLMVESMKMEIPVIAPRAGRVTKVHFNVGDPIGEGDAAVSLDG